MARIPIPDLPTAEETDAVHQKLDLILAKLDHLEDELKKGRKDIQETKTSQRAERKREHKMLRFLTGGR